MSLTFWGSFAYFSERLGSYLVTVRERGNVVMECSRMQCASQWGDFIPQLPKGEGCSPIPSEFRAGPMGKVHWPSVTLSYGQI